MIYTEEYIKANADNIDWEIASLYMDLTKLSNNFFLRFHNEILWKILINNITITTEFAQKYHKEIGNKSWYKNKPHKESLSVFMDSA